MTQVSKINGIPVINTVISGFTYDGINTLTIQETDGTTFNVVISNLTLTDLRATNVYSDIFSGNTSEAVFYGDGSNLTGIVDSPNFYTSGTTISGDTVIFNRNDMDSAYSVDLSNLTSLQLFYIAVNFKVVEEFEYVAPEPFKINTITNPSGLTTTITRNDLSYSLGESINEFDVIKLNVDSTGFIRLNCEL